MSSALVIGGTGGVGVSVVRRLADRGMEVLFTYFRSSQAAKGLEEASFRQGGSARGVRVDVSDPSRIDGLFDLCPQDLAVVVYAAANGVWRPLSEVTQRHWEWTINVNARGLLHVFRNSLPRLERTEGSFITLTSLGSQLVIPDYGLIGMSKASSESFVRYAAVEAGSKGVRVNAIAPGLMRTKAVATKPSIGDICDSVGKSTPLGRLVEPNDIADAIEWLMSSQAQMITGQVLVIDGGQSLMYPT